MSFSKVAILAILGSPGYCSRAAHTQAKEQDGSGLGKREVISEIGPSSALPIPILRIMQLVLKMLLINYWVVGNLWHDHRSMGMT